MLRPRRRRPDSRKWAGSTTALMDERTPGRGAQRKARSSRRGGHQSAPCEGEDWRVGTLLAAVAPQACEGKRHQKTIDQSKESEHLNPHNYAAAQQTCTDESVKQLCRNMVKNVPRLSSDGGLFEILRTQNNCVNAAFGRFEPD